VIYESPHRIEKLLADILEVYGDTQLVVAREVTKKFEEIRREKVSSTIEHFKAQKPKGEFIVII
jgi:16S rRNA (cytidine1402-2'-O)-methyltransferase